MKIIDFQPVITFSPERACQATQSVITFWGIILTHRIHLDINSLAIVLP